MGLWLMNGISIGTVLGFVVSYRTTSSFERYNEGRRLWAQIILGSRTFARVVWFHVPGTFDSLTVSLFIDTSSR
jgi:putative membrane protein